MDQDAQNDRHKQHVRRLGVIAGIGAAVYGALMLVSLGQCYSNGGQVSWSGMQPTCQYGFAGSGVFDVDLSVHRTE